ncbi:CHASE domain-containing protein [Rhodanobacter lindaniclasticus]
MRPRAQFPGLLALAYAQRGNGAHGEHFVTRWVQPRKGNEAVVDLDVARQPHNLAGLLASRDSGEVALSAPFRPVQQSGTGAPDGFTMRLPVFSPGDPPRTLAERRERTQGSIAVSFRISRLLGNVLQPDVGQQLRLILRDVTDPAHIVPMFDSAPAAAAGDGFRFERQLAYGGRVLDVVMRSRPTRPAAFDWSQSTLPVGVLASVLLALLVYSIVGTRQRALELGWAMSRRYRESEERFRALNELLPALVVLADADGGRITYANRASRDRLGERVIEQRLPALFLDEDLHRQLQARDAGGCGRMEVQLRDVGGKCFSGQRGDLAGGRWAATASCRLGGRATSARHAPAQPVA